MEEIPWQEEKIMGYCWDTLNNGKCEKCDGRLMLQDDSDTGFKVDFKVVSQLPCGGMGGGEDGRTRTCPSYCRTIREAKELQQDYEKQEELL